MTTEKIEKADRIIKLKSSESVVAAVPKEAFKAMFYMFAGKPDSKVKMMDRDVTIDTDDILDLNTKITDKFKLHNIDQSITTALIKFDKEESIEFGTWAEFKDYDFKIPYVTEEVTLRWDFLIKLPYYAAAQRHTLTVRMSSKPNPKDVFQMIFSQDPDDDSEIETKLGLCMVRVDFISHRLADELIGVVEEWNKSLKQPVSSCNWFCQLEKQGNKIARVVHYSLPIMCAVVSIFLLNYILPDQSKSATIDDVAKCFKWLLISLISLYVSINFGKYLASKCFMALSEYGSFAPFQITRGDENRNIKYLTSNKKKIVSFFINGGIALGLNIIAGIILWKILP